MSKTKRPTVAVLVIDAVGIPTLEYLLDNYDGKVSLPNLSRMGLGNLLNSRFHNRIRPNKKAGFAYAIEQASASADSVMGHREIVGVIDQREFDLFPNGFPQRYIAVLEKMVERKIIFNKMAGGNEAVELNRKEHEEREDHPLIVYASKCDPVIQVAANVNFVSPEELARIADMAFDLARGMGIKITRVISRPYINLPDGSFKRLTEKRHDKVISLEGRTLIDVASDAGIYTVSVGKPAELVDTPSWGKRIKYSRPEQIDTDRGIRFVHPKKTDTNPYSIQGVIDALRDVVVDNKLRYKGNFGFFNCVDTDSLWGHVEEVDFAGTLRSVEEIDRWIPYFLGLMKRGDVFIVTADHGMRHTDYGYHNKEPVYFLAVRKEGSMRDFRVRGVKTFAAVGDVVAQVLGIEDKYVEECKLGNILN